MALTSMLGKTGIGGIGMSVGLTILWALISIPLLGLFLWLSSKIFKLADRRYKTALKPTLFLVLGEFVISMISLGITYGLSSSYRYGAGASTMMIAMIIIPYALKFIGWICISMLLMVFLIKKFYIIEWGKAWLVWLAFFGMRVGLAIIGGIIMIIISFAYMYNMF